MNAKRMVAADVHAAGSWVVSLELAIGEVSGRRVSGPPSRVVDVLAPLGRGTRLVYEAGATGFGLVRAGAKRDIDVVVCAPGSVPRAPGDRVKTDRRDAERLLRLWRAGELSLIRVPTLEEESFRDLIRARADARGDLTRDRHRLGKFLLRRELRCRTGDRAWSQRWMRWVSSLRFDDLAAAATFADYLAAVMQALQRRSALDRAIEQAWPASPFAEPIARLRCCRGIDTLSAAGIATDVGDFHRFDHPRRLAGFLGIVPSEYSSGDRRRQGSITKAGPSHARRLLVEAAHHYRHRPAVGAGLQRRQHGIDPRVTTVAWRAQERLHRRFCHFADRREPSNVTTIALARELACFLWEAATIK